ncbi:MAG: hypothetical protein AAF380_01860, partial [Bacteroidota bacterium]
MILRAASNLMIKRLIAECQSTIGKVHFIKNIDFAFLLDIHRLQLPENDPLTLLFTAYPKYLTAKQKTVIINAV